MLLCPRRLTYYVQFRFTTTVIPLLLPYRLYCYVFSAVEQLEIHILLL